MILKHIAFAATVTATFATAAIALTNRGKTARGADLTCITSNVIPDHAIGQFPNKGNPNSIKEQNVEVCVTNTPIKGNTPQQINVPGIMENGILIRPGTADYYDASSAGQATWPNAMRRYLRGRRSISLPTATRSSRAVFTALISPGSA